MQKPSRPVPLDLKAAFGRFRNADPERLHFAAHSHHYWPDVARDAQLLAWDDAARLVDDKWDNVLKTVWGSVSTHLARHLGLADPATLVPAPNTHALVNRLFSCCPTGRTIRVLTTDGEFHSFRRQSERLAEDGVVELHAVPAEPFWSLAERLAAAGRTFAPDFVYVSQVLFSSGYALADLAALVDSLAAPHRLIVIDGYHGFLARPTDLGAIADRAFYLAGGYKYAMAGEGACFMHCPPFYGQRPLDTGWYAGFSALESGNKGEVAYATDGSRFLGATFDVSALYRFNAVQDWLAGLDLSVDKMLLYVRALERTFLREVKSDDVSAATLVVPNEGERGRLLSFRTP